MFCSTFTQTEKKVLGRDSVRFTIREDCSHLPHFYPGAPTIGNPRIDGRPREQIGHVNRPAQTTAVCCRLFFYGPKSTAVFSLCKPFSITSSIANLPQVRRRDAYNSEEIGHRQRTRRARCGKKTRRTRCMKCINRKQV